MEIVLEGPAKNALGSRMMVALIDQIRAAGDQPILLRGAGDAFSAGLDLKEVAGLDAPAMEAFLRHLQELIERLFHHPGPTVACVNGHAIAGGCILALACDYRVGTARPEARIGLNEVALGLQIPPGVLSIVRYRVAHAEAVVLGGGLHSPAEAVRLGLLDALADDPLEVGRRHLATLAAYPRVAYGNSKRDLRDGIGRPDPHSEHSFLNEVLPLWTSNELRERIRGFLERKRA